MTTPAGEQGRGLGVVIFDATPGGAGHVRELLELGRAWLEKASDILFVDDDHDRRCQTACLDCLLSFDAQAAAQRGWLDRPFALAVLRKLLDDQPPPPRPTSRPSGPGPIPPDPLGEVRGSREERLRAAQARRPRR